jgi:hypothetical protein
MSLYISTLIRQMLAAVIQINSDAVWHGLLEFRGHVNLVYVAFEPSDTAYSNLERARTEDIRSIYLDSPTYHDEETLRVALIEMRDWVLSYLDRQPEVRSAQPMEQSA